MNERDTILGSVFIGVGALGILSVGISLGIKKQKQLPVKYAKTLGVAICICLALIIIGSCFFADLLTVN